MNSLIRKQYRLVKQLRDSTERQTWLAFDEEQKQQVILKLLRFDDSFEWSNLKLFERESKILQQLEHSQIPDFLDFFELDDDGEHKFVLVQSYIEAKSLTEHIQAGRTFTDVDIKQIAESILSTLSYLHSQYPPVVHRDIKPSNVLLGDRSGNYVGKVYLVDFGSIQTPIAKTTDTFTVVGSYGYMAPEQFIGRASPASDLFGLGMTLIYLAAGQHPADLMTDNSTSDWRERIPLSPYLTEWVKRLTETDPSRRFKTVEEAIDHLKRPPALSIEKPSIVTDSLSKQYHLPYWSGMPLRYQAAGLSGLLMGGVIGKAIGYISKVIFTGDTSPGFGSILFILTGITVVYFANIKFQTKWSGYRAALSWISWGDRLQNSGNDEEAIAKYDRAVKAAPQYYSAWASKGYSLLNLNRSEEALLSYEKAIELKPNYSWLWGKHGWVLSRLGRDEEAISSYDRALELKPRYSWAWGKRGDALRNSNRHEEAVTSYDKAIRIDPKNPWFWRCRGAALTATQKYETAIGSCDRAIELDPDDYWAWLFRGEALMEEEVGRYEEALASFKTALSLDSQSCTARSLCSEVLCLLGHYDEAINYIDKQLELSYANSNNKPAWRVYRRNGEIHISPEMVAYEDIKEKISASKKTAPLEKKRLYERLVESYRGILERGDLRDSVTTFYRGEAYLLLGLYSDAISDMNTVIELSGEGQFLKAPYLRALAKRALSLSAESWEPYLYEAIQNIQSTNYKPGYSYSFDLVLYHSLLGQKVEAQAIYKRDCINSSKQTVEKAQRKLLNHLELFPQDHPLTSWYEQALAS